MKNFIIRIALSLALIANIINLSFNTYNRVTNKSPVETHKLIEAPIYGPIFILMAGWWKKINGGSPSGRPKDRPERPSAD